MNEFLSLLLAFLLRNLAVFFELRQPAFIYSEVRRETKFFRNPRPEGQLGIAPFSQAGRNLYRTLPCNSPVLRGTAR